MAVDGRPADACRRAEVFHGDAVEATLGKESGGRGEEHRTAIGLRLLADGEGDSIGHNAHPLGLDKEV